MDVFDLTSQAKVLANRRNALKSTGPKDASTTRFNALRHGLTSKRLVVMPFENPSEYDRLLRNFRADFQPRLLIEEILIEKMAVSLWRYQRILKAEKTEIEVEIAEAPLLFEAQEGDRRNCAAFGGYGDHLTGLTGQSRQSQQSQEIENGNSPLKRLEQTGPMRKQLYLEKKLRPATSSQLIRYESMLEREFYRALLLLTNIRPNRLGSFRKIKSIRTNNANPSSRLSSLRRPTQN